MYITSFDFTPILPSFHLVGICQSPCSHPPFYGKPARDSVNPPTFRRILRSIREAAKKVPQTRQRVTSATAKSSPPQKKHHLYPPLFPTFSSAGPWHVCWFVKSTWWYKDSSKIDATCFLRKCWVSLEKSSHKSQPNRALGGLKKSFIYRLELGDLFNWKVKLKALAG